MSLAILGTSARQKSDELLSSIGQAANRQVVNVEALSRLHMLDNGELRQRWRGLYKTQAPPSFSRELLVRAVAYRMQELARGGCAPSYALRLPTRVRKKATSSSGVPSTNRRTGRKS